MTEYTNTADTTITINLAVPDDAIGIQEVFYKTWLATYPNTEFGITVEDIEDRYKDRLDEERVSKRREQIAHPPEGNTLFVAKDGNEVVGICRVLKKANRNQLQAIYVLPRYQGKGIGQRFWNMAQKIIDPTKDTYVEVATYNSVAISFYKKIGFIDTGRRFSDPDLKLKSGSMIPEMEMIRRA